MRRKASPILCFRAVVIRIATGRFQRPPSFWTRRSIAFGFASRQRQNHGRLPLLSQLLSLSIMTKFSTAGLEA